VNLPMLYEAAAPFASRLPAAVAGHADRGIRLRFRRRWLLLAVTLIAALAECVSVPGALLGAAGLWLLFGAPIVLMYGIANAVVSTRNGRAILAVGGAVLGDILAALLTNTLLPWAGIGAPLERIPLAWASVFLILALTAAAPIPGRLRWRLAVPVQGLGPVLWLGSVCVILSIAGPIRLNNGLSGKVAMAALVALALLLVVLFVRRGQHSTTVTCVGLFFVAVSLLLLTSLRGWYITGHDVQREYEVFQLAYQPGRWQIAAFRDAYNACMSITVLPVSIVRLTGISGLYVFKVVIPLLFAVAPVGLYRAVRHGAPQTIALLSAIYFVAFPAYFTDMAFLARQEIAFLLLACVLLVLADSGRPLRARQTAATVLLVGIVLSHYSTTYVLLGVIGTAYALGVGWRLAARRRGSFGKAFQRPVLLTWWMIAIAAIAAVLWTGPATHTGGQAEATTKAAVLELLGKTSDSGSSDTSYSIFGGKQITGAQRLKNYATQTIQQTAQARADSDYLPLSEVDKYPVTSVDQADLPLTPFGRLLERAGVNVTGINSLIRLSFARLLQVLLLIGLVLAVVARKPVFRATSDQILLSVGAVVLIGVLTVLPQLSVDYGVLRAFQQGLFFFAPFIAAASVSIFRWTGRRATTFAFAIAVGLFLDLSGFVPTLLGGYPAQLHLANEGQYFDIYYLHPEERSGIAWLRQQAPEADRESVQSEIQTDRYTFGRVQTLLTGRTYNDIYPTLIGAKTYVFLGFTTVQKGEATLSYRGDLVTYRYPLGLLDVTKDKVYASEGAEVYR
jgi:uncharacterized membrane protein